MKSRQITRLSCILTVLAVGFLFALLVSKPAAQDTVTKSTDAPVRVADADPASKPTPRMADGHPSLTGFWAAGAPPDEDPVAKSVAADPNARVHETTRTADGSIFFDYAGPNGGIAAAEDGYGANNNFPIRPPYKPEYMTKVQAIVAKQYGIINIFDPNLDCKPAGVPRAGFGGYVVSDPKAVALLYEALPGPYYRIIYTDGRPHPTDYDTSYMGHSIGHWEGDTLVVDTVGLDDTTWLGDPGASLHSDKEHVVERWTRKGNMVTVETTVEDPVMFTKPWVLPVKHIALTSGDPSTYGNYILPAMCNTNDKEHLRVDDKYKCNWCNSESVYGGDPNKLTVPAELRKTAGQSGILTPAGAPPREGRGGE